MFIGLENVVEYESALLNKNFNFSFSLKGSSTFKSAEAGRTVAAKAVLISQDAVSMGDKAR